jgi:hypothetical protein
VTVEASEEVKRQIRLGRKPQQIAHDVTLNFHDNCSAKDVSNIRLKLKAEQTSGHTAIETMIAFFEEKHFLYETMVDPSSSRLRALCVIHPLSLQLLQAAPYILELDCTFRTNRYRLPMLHVVGVAPSFQTFSVAFNFLTSETEELYRWALISMKKLVGAAWNPSCLLTDREVAIMNALRAECPTVPHLVCTWHMEKAVRDKVTSIAAEEGEQILTAWKELLVTGSETDYLEQWEKLIGTFKSDKGEKAVLYLANNWERYRERIAEPWVGRVLHFGLVTTSRVESSHAALKRWLEVATFDFDELAKKRDIVQRVRN